MPPRVWKKPALRRVRLDQGPELEQLGLVLVLRKQQLELVLGPQEMKRELLLLGLLLQHLLGAMLPLLLWLRLERMMVKMQR